MLIWLRRTLAKSLCSAKGGQCKSLGHRPKKQYYLVDPALKARNDLSEASDKITKRDKHRWELDPASSEDYKGRK